ncbi:uncharacterized protein BX663DRAFT_435566 [Cokeromyces recurvatus]|uniref:uncharacterized protein n=1 Tax=Cokeromyces recurvatus TaxID=90255 RepID=UPI00221F0281|nr:uncharacterized protein BX663DRAFT_435566 [Cokeromyces recurvatus]KAI7902470.1 hypothetical protein BX663DRAFT_435566 [Cokeromyces recurvatus]
MVIDRFLYVFIFFSKSEGKVYSIYKIDLYAQNFYRVILIDALSLCTSISKIYLMSTILQK